MLYDSKACVNSYYWSNLSRLCLLISFVSTVVFIVSLCILFYKKTYNKQFTNLGKKVNKVLIILSPISYFIGFLLSIYVKIETNGYYSVMEAEQLILPLLIITISTIIFVIKMIIRIKDKEQHLFIYKKILLTTLIFLLTMISFTAVKGRIYNNFKKRRYERLLLGSKITIKLIINEFHMKNCCWNIPFKKDI